MFGTVALVVSAALAPAAKAHPPATVPIPADTPHGFLYQPARDLHPAARLPARCYDPQPGDVLLLSNSNAAWALMYKVALTGKPGHAAVVARRPDGSPGVLEAGHGETLWTRFVPAAERLNDYPGTIWVRRRVVPLTECQNQRLSAFAHTADGSRYDTAGFAKQITPFRNRGPLRTFLLGRPKGAGQRYFCAEAVLEALAYAGVLDPDTTRPSATYPRDLFFDDSPNLYVRRHPPLADGWEPPALWTPVVGSTAKGKERNPPR